MERLRDACARPCVCLQPLWERIIRGKTTGEEPPAAGGEGRRDPGPVPEAPAEDGGVFTALWAFDGHGPEELSFREGDLFTVTDRRGGWWDVRRIDRNGRVLGTGIVPGNYLAEADTLEMEPWFFGMMNRLEAQSLLMAEGNQQGAFLVRESEKSNVGYVLSVRSSNRVKHFKILGTDGGQFWVEQSQQFRSLSALVEYYCNYSLIDKDRLEHPCSRKKPKVNQEVDFPDDEWERPKEEFTLEEKLGCGYFADVYRGRWKNHINVAVKIIKTDSEMNHQEFQREVQMLKNLRHRHLISLFAICMSSPPYYIITELMEKGSLLDLLRSPEGQQQDVATLIDMGAQVADGMSYLEEKNSIHRDLAARNVLVGEDYVCKVADFGLARVIKEPFYITEEKKIPYKWSAPEAISHGRFSIKSDVWSFGVLLYEIMTYGGIPYPGCTTQEVYEHVSKGYRMPAPQICPDFLYQIMLSCWSSDPEERPAFKSLKVRLDSSSYELE